MSGELAERLARCVARIAAVDLLALAQAARNGPATFAAFRAESSHPELLLACADIDALVTAGEGPYVAGILEGALAQQRTAVHQSIDVVWTGPTSSVTSSRLTAAVIAGLLNEAEREIVLVSYASYPPKPVRDALVAASARGVSIVLLAERPGDRPGFNGDDLPIPDISCTRLHWPAFARDAGAALHAKILIIDGLTALVGSANFTGHAMERNLECGLLVRGGPLPAQILRHLMTLKGIEPVPA